MKKGKIMGYGSYLPSNVVRNQFLEGIVETSDEWITTRTGIKQRHISEGENTSHLATKAAQQALDNAGLQPDRLDLIIVATITPDAFTPATACFVQAALEAKNAFAFDLTAGCSGFVYALNVANQFIRSGQAKHALVIGAEVLSKVVNWTDRNTCVLFGDGAGAVVLGATDDGGILATYAGSAGDTEGVLIVPAVGVNNPFTSAEDQPSHIYMNGKEVFKFATQAMRNSIDKVLTQAQCSIDDIKYIIPHQANNRIIEYVAKKARIPRDKFYLNLERIGNTSSASIPIALAEMGALNLLQAHDKLIFVGFGGGFTWGSILVEL